MKYITVSSTLNDNVLRKMEDTLDICRQKYHQDIPSIPLKFAQIGRRAGVCMSRFDYFRKLVSSKVIINPDFFKNYYEDMMSRTVPHEVAHYVSSFLYGRAGHGHGVKWKSVMRTIGLPAADRCHSYSLEGVKVRNRYKPYKYTCHCVGREFMLTPYRHKAHQETIARGQDGLYCTKCKKTIIYQGFVNESGRFIERTKPATPIITVPVVYVPKIEKIVSVVKPIVEQPPTHRVVTKFVNGSLVAIRVPIAA